MKNNNKIVKLLMSLLIVGTSITAYAEDNTLRAGIVEIAEGSAEASLSIYLDNNVSMCGFEVFVELPEGVTIKHEYDEDEEDYVWGINKGGRLRTEHGVNCAVDKNGYVHLLCADLVTNKNFYDSSTKKDLPLVTLSLNVAPTVEKGYYKVVLHDILLNHNDNPTIIEYTPSDRKSYFFVKPTSGIFVEMKNEVLSFMTSIGAKLTKSDFNTMSSYYSSVTCLDLIAAELGDDVQVISDLYSPSVSKNALVYVCDDASLAGPNVIVNDVCNDFVLTDGYKYHAAKPFTAVSAKYDANVSTSLGYKTLVLPYDCPVPAGFEAYEVGSVSGSELQMEKVMMITANKPVILKNAGVATMAASNVTIGVTDGNLVGGELIGTYEDITAPVGSYVLQNHGGNVAFYQVGEGVQPKVGAFRAYLAPQVAGAKMISVNFGDVATGIDEFNAGEADEAVYNVAGQRVSKAHRGVNVIRSNDGVKKVYVK